MQLNPVKCSTLTICWVEEGLKSPRGETEVLLRVKETDLTDKKEGHMQVNDKDLLIFQTSK